MAVDLPHDVEVLGRTVKVDIKVLVRFDLGQITRKPHLLIRSGSDVDPPSIGMKELS